MESDPPKTQPGVCFFCHDGQGNYLFSKRSAKARDEQGAWEPGGGAVNADESDEQALIREIEEEYCTYPITIQRLGTRTVLRTSGCFVRWQISDFRVLIDRAQVRIGEPAKCDSIVWLTIDGIKGMHPLHSELSFLLDRYRSALT